MPRHVWHDCERDGCSPRPESCVYCRGGLQSCTICHGAEAALATECPGVPMTSAQMDRVMDGQVDFIGGRWKFVRELDASKPDYLR